MAKNRSLNNNFYKLILKGDKMLKKNLIAVFIVGFLFTFASLINAQEKLVEKKESKMMMQQEDMQKCTDKIANDSTMCKQMMDKKTMQNKGDKEAMMQRCKKMMDSSELHKKMMNDKEMMKCGMMQHDMKSDSTKTMNQSDHESHHQEK